MTTEQPCLCPEFPDETHIPMGCDDLDQQFFATVEGVKDHGGSQWWLYSAKCRVCGQNWLVAQEERIFDEYFLVKLSLQDAELIEGSDIWPKPFQTYADVLRRGHNAGLYCGVFFDDIAASLVWSVEDLRGERPDISVQEIADLLGIDTNQALRVITAVEKTAEL
jgi:hypothetical protein